MAAEVISFPLFLARTRAAVHSPVVEQPGAVIDLTEWRMENSQVGLVARRAMRIASAKFHGSSQLISANLDENGHKFFIHRSESGFMVEQDFPQWQETFLYDINSSGIELRTQTMNPKDEKLKKSEPIEVDVFNARALVRLIRNSRPFNYTAKPGGS